MSIVITIRGRRATLLLLAILALLGSLVAPAQAAVTDLEKVAEQYFHERHVEVRQHPTDEGVSDYAATTAIGGHTDLLATARSWSAHMASTREFEHNPNLGTQVCCWRKVGENIAYYRGALDTPEQVRAASEALVQAWIRSDTHRRNMMDPAWDQVSIGVVIDGDRLWATANFRRLQESATPPGEPYGTAGPHPAGEQSVPRTGPSPTARNTTALCAERNHPGFVDAVGTTHEASIRCAAAHELVKGQDATHYGPNGAVTRGQVMSFVRGALEGAGVPLDPNAPNAFVDDNGTVHEQSANMIAKAGFVAVGDKRLRPNEPASRGFIANVVGRALAEVAGATSSGDYFDDDNGHADESWINILASSGVSTGAGGRTFGPDAGLTRGQMATLLIRAFDALR